MKQMPKVFKDVRVVLHVVEMKTSILNDVYSL